MNYKKYFLLLCPLLLFAILIIPYSYLNSELLVDVFGCGCPKIDSAGNVIENSFNANTFTAYFWMAVAVLSTALSVFLAFRFIQNKILRWAYIGIVFAISIEIARLLAQLMMWH